MKRLWRKEDGSLTLEAAMVMPVFLLFIVFLATIIRISVADMALKHAVSETAEVVATHAYPAFLAKNQTEAYLDQTIKNYTGEVFDLSDVTKVTDEVFKGLNVDIHNFFEQIAGNVLEPVVQNKFEEANSDPFFNSSNIEVQVKSDLEYIEIQAAYPLPIHAPFLNKTITLEQRAYERLWGS